MEVRIHPVTILLLGVCIISGYADEAAVLFGSLLFHEICHIAAAYSLGVSVQKLEILPFGASIKTAGRSSGKNGLIALFGPFGSILLAGGAFFFGGDTMKLWYETNLMLAGWNLLPAFPLDGGAVLRFLLSGRMQEQEAVRQLVRLSYAVMAGLLLYVGYLFCARQEIAVSIVCLIVLIGISAKRERQYLGYLPIGRMAVKQKLLDESGYLPTAGYIVRCDMAVRDAVKLFRADRITCLTVLGADDAVCGILYETDIWQKFAVYGASARIGDLIKE